MGERQPDMKRHQAGLRSGAKEGKYNRKCRREGGVGGEPHGLERIAASRTREQPKPQKQAQGAKARHHEINEGGTAVRRIAVARQHNRPGGEGHEFPCQQEREGVVGEYDEVHPGQKGRVKREDPGGSFLMAAIAECVQARDRRAQVDHHKKERTECVDANACTDAWQADWQYQCPWRPGAEKARQRRAERNQPDRERAAIDERNSDFAPTDRYRKAGKTEEAKNAPQPSGGWQVDPRHLSSSVAPACYPLPQAAMTMFQANCRRQVEGGGSPGHDVLRLVILART